MATATERIPAELQHVDDPRKVGVRIRSRREERELSQRQLAFPGCTAAFISRIEQGDRTPSSAILEEIGRRLKVDPHWLAHGVDDPRSRALREARTLVTYYGDHGFRNERELGSYLVALDAALERIQLEPWEEEGEASC